MDVEADRPRTVDLGGGLGIRKVTEIAPATFPFQKQQLILIKGTAWPDLALQGKVFPALVIKATKNDRKLEYMLLDEGDWDPSITAMGGWTGQHPPRAIALHWVKRVWGKAWPTRTGEEKETRQYQLSIQEAMMKKDMVLTMTVSPSTLIHIDGIIEEPPVTEDPLQGVLPLLTTA
jgi:hypothetical protein